MTRFEVASQSTFNASWGLLSVFLESRMVVIGPSTRPSVSDLTAFIVHRGLAADDRGWFGPGPNPLSTAEGKSQCGQS